MILTVKELKSQVDCGNMTDAAICSHLTAIESIIRKYTHNNFQVKQIRFECAVENGVIQGSSLYVKIGDTLEITQSPLNRGLCTVTEKNDKTLTVDAPVFDCPHNRFTLVRYPADVKQCAVNMFSWKLEFGGKIGIKSESETLSRHSESVTYEDSSSLYMGYPKGIMNALSLHVKARCWK